MKILLIEDDKNLAKNLETKFKTASFAVDLAYNFEDALVQSIDFYHEYDCLVLDVNLPDGNGFKICEELRKKNILVPIVMMTARGAITDKVKGLDIGADDYVTKPVDSQELIARIRAVIRRNSKVPVPIIKIADLEINPQTQRVTRASKIIIFSSKEFAVLEFLARHSDEVVTRTMIMEHVWGSDFETFSNVIDVYIKNLRLKIDKGFGKKLIHTIRGSGYSLSNKR